VEEFLPYFVALSERIAHEVTAHNADVTSVDLDWDSDFALERTDSRALLPLADWRALTRAWIQHPLVSPEPPDETIAPLSLDPANLTQLARAARAGNHGPYPALRHGSLLVLASVRWPRTQLRGVHCAASDPVSFALLRKQNSAEHPKLPGWSAGDTAARAVAEHRGWLADPASANRPVGERLGMLITAARAALFQESLADSAPQLQLTVAKTLRQLALRRSQAAPVTEAAEEAYRRWRSAGAAPSERIVRALHALVVSLEAYRGVKP
jgi:predicted hotdog family 3-hydroxylacyl-ACP dehydratase